MSRRRLLVAAGVVWGLGAAAVALHMGAYSIDDFFITDRYAWNLAHGYGFVFNPGERVFGTTAPGLGLLLAAVSYASGLSVPAAGTLATAVALVAAALLLLAEATKRGRTGEALAAGSYLVVCPYLWFHTGSEAPLVVALLAAAAWIAARRPLAAGLAAGAAVWLRPDAGLGVALLALLLWRERRRLPWAFSLAAVG